MTIDEAIRHAEDKARELGCTECAQEHRQLAGWLRELKFRRKAQADLDAARWRAMRKQEQKAAILINNVMPFTFFINFC